MGDEGLFAVIPAQQGAGQVQRTVLVWMVSSSTSKCWADPWRLNLVQEGGANAQPEPWKRWA